MFNRYRFMRRMIVGTLAVCLSLFSWTTGEGAVSAADDRPEIPLIGINDVLIVSDQYQAFTQNDTTYVPVMLTAQKMGVSAVVYGEKIVLSNGAHELVLHKNDKDLLLRNNRTMVRLRLLAETFDYGLTMPTNGVYRMMNGTAQLSDQDFADKYKTQIDKHVSEQNDPQPVQPSATPTPDTEQGHKIIYLTFDDGPTAHTTELLDVLAKYHAKATFFMLGPGIQRYPAAAKRTSKDGHGLGLHGITHQVKKIYASPDAAVKEMLQDQLILSKTTGSKTTLIRTPYGSKPYLTAPYRDKLAASGFHLWDWNVDSNDWRYTKNPEHFVNTVLHDVSALQKRGITPVVLMHDSPTTIKVLPELMMALQKQGYLFKPLTGEIKPVNFWDDER